MTETQWVLYYLMALVRVAAFVGTMPALGQTFVPRMVKVTLALCLAFLMSPDPTIDAVASLEGWVGLSLGIGREFLIGAILGFSSGLLLEAVKVTGAYVGHQMGLSLGSSDNLIDNEAITLFGQLMEMFAIVVLFSLDAHHFMMLGLYRSFDALPVTTTWGAWLAERAAASAIDVAEVGLLVGGPVIVFLFAITCFNGILMKAAPQFNLFSVGMPLRVAGGVVALLVWFPQIIATLVRLFQTRTFILIDI